MATASKEITKKIVDDIVKAINDNFKLQHRHREIDPTEFTHEDKMFLDSIIEKTLIELIPEINK